MNMARSLKNPNPVTLSRGQARQISSQLHGHTFCAECEERLNKNGEKWVLANLPQDYGSAFSLQEALIPEQPTFIGDNINIYAGRKISAFDMDKLVYFGMSVFWRGAAREWKSSTGDIAPPVDLGEYFEPIRQYLMGGPFPDGVFIVILVHNLKPVGNVALVVQRATNRYGDHHWFYVNGLGFQLYLGNSVPTLIRNICAFHSACGAVVVDGAFGKAVYQFIKDRLNSSDKSESVMKLVNASKGPRPEGNETS